MPMKRDFLMRFVPKVFCFLWQEQKNKKEGKKEGSSSISYTTAYFYR